MKFHALACDFDGTLAKDGRVTDRTYQSLERLKKSGRRLLLVTGRELEDLFQVFPEIGVFDRIVAENGAIVYDPSTKKTRLLADKPPEAFIQALKRSGISPLSVGHVIVATRTPHELEVMEVIRKLGLELQIIFNKGAVMVLPPGVNKAVGLMEALKGLKLSPHNVVAVGDAENDHAFLKAVDVSVAVSNALPMVKETADYVTKNHHGEGVVELIEEMLQSDLRLLASSLARHRLALGRTAKGEPVTIPSDFTNILVVGAAGGEKATLATSFLERLIENRYQFCIVDPGGDYPDLEWAVVYGDAQNPPGLDELLSAMQDPGQNGIANLLGIPPGDRPAFFKKLFAGLEELRTRYGRPHWIVIDEAHHLLPETGSGIRWSAGSKLENLFLITADPQSISKSILSLTDVLIAIGGSMNATVKSFADRSGSRLQFPAQLKIDLDEGEALLWNFRVNQEPILFEVIPPEPKRTIS